MAKKILVINASPRKNGNTDALCAAFVQGAESAGHTSETVKIREHTINPCLGCYSCVMKKGDPCAQKDDMKEIYSHLETADVVVFASPLYWWQFTAQMKTVIDRLFAVAAAADMKIPKKEVALIIAAEDASDENFSQIVPYYETCLVGNLNWENKGMVLAGGVNMPGDVEETKFIDEAAGLGASI